MISRCFLLLLLPVLTLSCALPPSAPPLPATARTIVVLPPNNRTGDPLLVESASFLHPYADRPGRVTVPDVLATAVREQLARRGVKVIAPETVTAAIGNQTPRSPEEAAAWVAQGKLEGNALYIEIRRWEADMSPLHPQRIIVAVEARLLDPATGHAVWTAHRPLHPVPTPGVATRWMAYTIAARKVAEELFASTTMEENTMQGRTPISRHAEISSTGVRIQDDVQDNPVARQLLQETHARMYKWPATFAGYQAMLTVQEEERRWHGAATMRPRQAVGVQLDGDDSVRAWVQESLLTQAMHLADMPFEQGDGRYVLTFDPQEAGTGLHPRGVRVILHGGRLASWYRISEQRYSQIGRTAPDGTQRINTIERYEAATDGRLYATHYVLAHFPAHGASLVGLASYVNEFVEHQPALLLPSRRTIWHVEGGCTRARVIALSAHRVLG
ncbi:MAG TPA: DUF3386 family protein [Candidatus Saccharimonadia bacterium]|nr:DUF3386 family protein [Candidatus Saccharimonadia bacterium]